MADGDLDIDALLEGPIDQKQDRDKSQSKEVRERTCAATMITTVPLEGAETPRCLLCDCNRRNQKRIDARSRNSFLALKTTVN